MIWISPFDSVLLVFPPSIYYEYDIPQSRTECLRTESFDTLSTFEQLLEIESNTSCR